jgi:hypothetical protein
MARTAYKKASQGTGLWVVICLTGLGIQTAVLLLMMSAGWEKRYGAWVFGLAVIPFPVALLVGWRLLARQKRGRIGHIVPRLGRLGFRVTENPNDAEKQEFSAPVGHLFSAFLLQTGAAGLQWIAVDGNAPAPARLFEHEYLTGSGKSRQTHHTTVMAWPAGHPELRDAGLASSPWFTMARWSWWTRRTVRHQELKNSEFADVAKAWSLRADEGTARRFLTPTTRAALQESPRDETWFVGAGWVCCSIRGALDESNLAKFLAHGRRVVAPSAEKRV